MYKSIYSAVLLAAGFLMLAAPAVAQQQTYTINVPFSFITAEQAFPAGQYQVVQINQWARYLRGMDNTVSAFVKTTSISERAGRDLLPMLVFHRYGDRYFLHQVWFDGSNTGANVLTSRAEVQYAKLGQETETRLLASAK